MRTSHDWFWFNISDWMEKREFFLSQSCSTEMQNQWKLLFSLTIALYHTFVIFGSRKFFVCVCACAFALCNASS